MTPVMLVLMIPLMLWIADHRGPQRHHRHDLQLHPPAIPFAMILRLAADEPVPMWQIPASIVWGYAMRRA